MTKTEAYKLLINKIELKKKTAKQKRIERKELAAKEGELITKAKVRKMFGFCEDGINDFCEALEITESKIRTKELLKRYKTMSKDWKDYLRKEYGTEIAQLLNYIR